LNRRFPVTFHWQKRARAPLESGGPPIIAWRRVVGALGPRIAAGGGTHVVWMDAAGPTAAAAALLTGNGICVGVGHAAPGAGEVTPKDIIGCLREGVPCFFWLAKPLKGRGGAATRKALCRLFAQQEAREAPVSIGELLKLAKESDPLSSIRIVWDEPGHLPFIPGFANPARATTGTPK
jgi:vWA-MoxR associated protein C-terminal domain